MRFHLFFLASLLLVCQQQWSIESGYIRHEITTSGAIKDAFWLDQNRDGRQDLFLMCGDVNQGETRELLVFLHRKKGLGERPDFTIRFPKEAIVFDVGDIGSLSDGPAIVFADGQGLSYFAWQADRFESAARRLCSLSSIYRIPSPAAPIHVKLFYKLRPNREQALCLFDYHQLHILAPWLPGGISQNISISLPVMSSVSSSAEAETEDYDPVTCAQRLLIRVPELFVGRFAADAHEDLLAVVKDRITVFPGRDDGGFGLTPSFQTTLNLSSQSEKGFIKPNFRVHMADANGDGRLDALVSTASMKTNRSSTKVYLFLNQQGKIAEKPDQVILFANTMGNNIDFQDINQDKCVDLIIPSANMSLLQFIKILISQKLNYSKNIHLWKKSSYSQEPDIELQAEARFNLEDPGDLQGAFFYTGADFNGDGRFDLLKSDSDKKELSFFLGQQSAKGLFAGKAAWALHEERIPSEIDCHDRNSDGCADLCYRYSLNAPKKFVVWLSSIPGERQ